VEGAVGYSKDIRVSEEPMSAVEEYARIPMAFQVAEVLDVEVERDGLGGFTMSQRTVDVQYSKNYDALEGPLSWYKRFDTSKWLMLGAYVDNRRVGGAVVAFNTPGIIMLEGRRDLAVLWDVRVSPDYQRRGVGTALFREAETRARERGCRHLKIETQNINVPACRFYLSQGCVLGGINRFAYPEFPEEIQLLWYKDL
jgi:GNAT superfamily N-acetyltransferase